MTFGSLSHIAVDVLVGAPGPWNVTTQLGGAGLYAALGLRMGTRSRVVLSSGVGRDLFDDERDFFQRWQLDTGGLSARSDCTPRTLITYHPDGSRGERSLLGDAQFAAHRPEVGDLRAAAPSLQGLYTFQDADSSAWDDIIGLRRDMACHVLWEISAAERGPDGWERVRALLGEVDVVSLNVEEGRGLLGTSEPDEIAASLVGSGARVAVVRAGARGSVVAGEDTVLRVSATPVGRVVDPTGAGNTYCGAFLGAWVDTRSLEVAARTAAAAASFALEQSGPPPAPPSPGEIEARAARTTVAPVTSRAVHR